MDLILLLVVVVGLVAVGALTGLVRSLLRLIAALGLGLLVPGLIYLLFVIVLPESLGLSVAVPSPVYLLAGALSALGVLTWRR